MATQTTVRSRTRKRKAAGPRRRAAAHPTMRKQKTMPLLHEVPAPQSSSRKKSATGGRKHPRVRQSNGVLPQPSRALRSEFEQLSRRWKRLLPQLITQARH